MSKYGHRNHNWFEAIVNKMGGEDAAERFLSGQLVLMEPSQIAVVGVRLDWQKTAKSLGMEKEIAQMIERFGEVPESEWAIYIPKGLTHKKVITALKAAGSGYDSYYSDLDKSLADDPKKDFKANDRDPNRDSSYAIAVRATVEADEENKNLSKNQLVAQKHIGMVAMERLVLELAYFLTTGKHLDIENVTLCTGSRDAYGYVPYVLFHSDFQEVYVFYDSPDYSGGGLRSRSVRVLSAKASEAQPEQTSGLLVSATPKA